MEAPPGWIDESVISWVRPAPDGFAASVVITRDSISDFAAYVEQQLKALRRSVKGYRTIASRDEDGGRIIEHAFRTDSNVSIRQIQFFADRSPQVLVASLSHAEHHFESHRTEFEQIIAGLRFA